MSAVAIPDWVERARSPEEIERAARQLQEIDAPQAIEPLARLSRRAPGWLAMELGLIVRLIIGLTGFALAFGLVAVGVWIIYHAINAFLRTFYTEWQTAWWILWVVLVGLWLWRDTDLHAIVADRQLNLSSENMTPAWIIVLKPFYSLAVALRLCVALIFMTLRVALPIIAIIAIVNAWQGLQARNFDDPDHMFTYGFAAGALLVLYGLFIFSEWPRTRPARRNETVRRRLVRFLLSIALATAVGLFIRERSHINGDLIGLITSIIFFAFFMWFLRVRSTGNPFDMKWLTVLFIPRLKVSFADRQGKFLKWTLFVLGLFGLGVVMVTFAQNWAMTRVRFPDNWLNTMRDIYGYSNPSHTDEYQLLEPWLVGLTIGCSIALFGAVFSTGWAMSLGKPFAWPFVWMHRTAQNLLAKLRARLAVRDAVRYHRARNMRLIGQPAELAVCQDHLARFESRTTWLAYGRKWTYWWCRVCKSDAKAFTNVETMRGVLDQSMPESVMQQGTILTIDLLRRLDSQSAQMPLDLQEVYIGRIDEEHDIELFITKYRSLTAAVKVPVLKQIKLRIGPEANLGDNVVRMLKNTFRT